MLKFELVQTDKHSIKTLLRLRIHNTKVLCVSSKNRCEKN